ncbi:hypothetical protein F3Y22_tig00116997pilonHSYRG01040 [Hibiscus syriacus]|uniref:Uncharacterized protein n=1 Tax=Hibiscus syriacus TaxID=106335 RepID=A0A6A2WF15_HIBSY|nr:hypothetical protein F3Y22_tig00116997pilonHSYRG01040 [Hibiscus syriacus]
MEDRPETELISIPATPRVSTPEIQTAVGEEVTAAEVFDSMDTDVEEVGHLTKLNPQDAWLPITESRNGNAHYAAFHNLNAGVGFLALVIPVAFAFLGWLLLGYAYPAFECFKTMEKNKVGIEDSDFGVNIGSLSHF